MLLDRVTGWIKRRELSLRAWEAQGDNRARKVYWRAYVVAFLICCVLALLGYAVNGRSLLWSVDGLEQYFPFFIYEGEWLRNAFAGLFTGQGLQFALWEWNIGYGSDVLLTLDVIMDPINLLSALAPGAASEWMYQFTIVLRLFLAGVTFSIFALRRGAGRFATLCGSLLYCLSVTNLVTCLWPGFSVAMILFPLLLAGADKMLVERSPFLFIGAAFLFFLTSYYFTYMACLMLVFYCAVRVFQTQDRVTVASFLLWVLKFLGCLVLACALSAWILIPELQVLLGMDRVTAGSTVVNPLYSWQYYQELIGGFIGGTGVGSDCYIGYGGIALIACISLFAKRRHHTALKVCFIVMTLMLMIPYVGSVLNGFNYATNRWVWAYALCVCGIVTIEIPTLLSLTHRAKKSILLGVLVYAGLVFLLPAARTEFTVACLFVCALVCAVLFMPDMQMTTRRAAFSACVALAIAVNAFYFIDANEGGWANSATPIGAMYAKHTTLSANSTVAQIKDNGYWRYDASPAEPGLTLAGNWFRPANNSCVLGLSGIDFYCSLYNANIDAFHTEMAVAEDNINFMYRTLGSRSILEEVSGVKYYLYPNDGIETLPYNYNDPSKVVAQGSLLGQPTAVTESIDPLPIGYTYGTVIPRSEYLAMTPIQKQQALLLGAVVDDSRIAGTNLPHASSASDARINEQQVAFTVANIQGLTLENGSFNVTSPNATITLTLDNALANSETYLYINNLQYNALSPSQLLSETYKNSLPWYKRAHLMLNDLTFTSPTDYIIRAHADKGFENRRIVNSVSSWHMYGGKSNWLLNLGYSAEAQSTVTITFPTTGLYTFDQLQIVCQPMDNVNTLIDDLKIDYLQNIQRSTNQLTGHIELAQPKMLYLSIPYSEGWTCFVDGNETSITKTNTAFMGIMLDAGSHDIRLSYETPGLRTGALISLGGLGALGVLAICYRRSRAKRDSKA